VLSDLNFVNSSDWVDFSLSSSRPWHIKPIILFRRLIAGWSSRLFDSRLLIANWIIRSLLHLKLSGCGPSWEFLTSLSGVWVNLAHRMISWHMNRRFQEVFLTSVRISFLLLFKLTAFVRDSIWPYSLILVLLWPLWCNCLLLSWVTLLPVDLLDLLMSNSFLSSYLHSRIMRR
jgi:hypothetical protein